MKTETEIIKSIIEFFKQDENVKCTILNGSRANPNAPKDFMQDYDMALFVDNLKNAEIYKLNQSWTDTFGEKVIIQQNDFEDNSFIVMIQYFDGLRLDISFHDIKLFDKSIKDDSLSVLLYDRDNKVGSIPQSNESTYFIQQPTQFKWNDTLNDIWWLQTYIAKELWRDEIPLAKELYDVWIMSHLRDLIIWCIAIEFDWKINVGHGGKWLKHLLKSSVSDYIRKVYKLAPNANKVY